jgi:predicted RNA-binding Zn ribbon-like protein
MKPLLLAGHPALELLDSTMCLRGETVELIGDGRALLDWFVDVGLCDASFASLMKRRFVAAELDEVAAEARKLRAWATSWIARWSTAPRASYEPELRRLNALLQRANDVREVVRTDDRLEIVVHPRGRAADELIGLLASKLGELIVSEEPSLVKQCAGADCTLWFIDRTKAHRRRFCSMTACGNREKVAAFRERQRRSSKR